MSSSAFNALLKTLEEPPANVVFILATTEPQKVLPTILSRVQRFDFTKVSDEDIISKMSEILEKENVTYEEGSLELISRLADGGVRDALSILDQVVSYSGDNISIEDINTLFGLLNVKDKLDFVRKIGSKDLASVINTAKDMYSRGIDIVKFGENISIIQKRSTFENISILEVYEKAIEVFRDYYQYEVIQGADRKKMEKIPEAGFREAIANALIHRVWDVDSQIRVSMFDDRIDIVSPGGLPSGITEEEYLSGKLSVLRNRNLANVFYRLGFVEIFGTGITRIKQLYAEALIKPDFEVSENAIKIVLPIFEKNADLTEDEIVVYKLLSKTMLKPISEVAPYVPFGKSKTTKLLKGMCEKGVITVEGKGKGTKYIIS